MSLSWQVTNDVPDDLVWLDPTDPRKGPREPTKTIIFHTMMLGVPRITHHTYRLFYRRYYMYCLVAEWEPQYAEGDVEALIGLSTNASSITDAAFKKILIERLERSALNR